MGTIFTLTLKTLKQNKKRTILTVCTIIISVAMMTAVLCGAWSMLLFMREKEAAYSGDYAYSLKLTSQTQMEKLIQDNNVEDVSLLGFDGSSFYGEHSNKTLLAVAKINDAFTRNFSLEQYLLEGRFPNSENEIILTQEFLEDNDLTFSIGDTIELSLGTRVWDEIDAELNGLFNYMGERESFHPTAEKSYTIVGIISEMKDSKEGKCFNAYSGIGDSESDLTAFVKCKKISKAIYREAEENATTIGGQDVSFNSDLLMYHGVTGGKGTTKVIIVVATLILLLMSASAAMISNVLSISLQERIRQLGMLASIGATSRQKKMSVTVEAVLLGMIGIPLGLIMGIGLTIVVLAIIRVSFEMMFTFGVITLTFHLHPLILMLSGLSGIGALFFACKVPGRMAARVTIIDTLKQTNIYELKSKRITRGKIMSVIFGIYGALASKNIHRNPKRFRAITVSIIFAVVLGLSLYSFSDFMMVQTSMQMKEDGSSYTDVEVTIPYKELSTAIKAISDEGISADVSYSIARYMSIETEKSMQNPDMSGYFIGGSLAEFYVVGMDREHFRSLCEKNGIDYAGYNGKTNQGILINSAMGNYGKSSSRIIIGSPLVIDAGTEVKLQNAEDDISRSIIIQDVVTESNQNIQSQFVRNLPVIIVPFEFYDWLVGAETYIELAVTTEQHAEVTDCLADLGFFMVVDQAEVTENSRQIYTLLKLLVYVFMVLMTMIIGLNVCNTMSNTIDVRRSEFAVLRSVGMTYGGLQKMLLLESTLYGIKSLIVALPVSLIVHYIMYRLISTGMTPFVFYINWEAYGIAVALVAVVVITAMLFSFGRVRNIEIVKELKSGSM